MIAVENTPKQMIAVVFARSALVASASIQEIKDSQRRVEHYPLCSQVLSERRPNTGILGLLLHRDNDNAHTADATLDSSEEDCGQLPPYSPVSAACEFVSVPSREAAKQFQWVGDARAFFEGVVPTSAWSDAMVT